MVPGAIPGDNQQIALVREILKDLHYSLLSVAVDSGKDHKLSVMLALEGNNLSVYNGRPVKLKVHLSGDVLNFIQQNLTAFTDPKQLLKQGKNAEK